MNQDNDQFMIRIAARRLVAAVIFVFLGFSAEVLRPTYSSIRIHQSEFLTVVGLAAVSISIALILEWSARKLFFPHSEIKINNSRNSRENRSENCVRDLTENWLYFRKTLQFKAGVPLEEILVAFAMPSQEFVRQRYPELAVKEKFWDMIARAIVLSGTESTLSVNRAVEMVLRKEGSTNNAEVR